MPAGGRDRKRERRPCVGPGPRGKNRRSEAEYRRAYESSRSLARAGAQGRGSSGRSRGSRPRPFHFLFKHGQSSRGTGLIRRAIASRETILAEPPDDPERQKDLATRIPSWPYPGRAQPLGRGRPDVRKAFDRFDDLARRFPSVPGYRTQAAVAVGNRARLLSTLLRYADAEAAYRVAIDIDGSPGPRLSPAAGVGGVGNIRFHNNFAVMLRNQGKHPAAEQELRKPLAILRRSADQFPDVPSIQSSLSNTLIHLANALDYQKKTDDARTAAERPSTWLAAWSPGFPDNPRCAGIWRPASPIWRG